MSPTKDYARCYACKRVYAVSYPRDGDGSCAVLRTHRAGDTYCAGSRSPVEEGDYVDKPLTGAPREPQS